MHTASSSLGPYLLVHGAYAHTQHDGHTQHGAYANGHTHANAHTHTHTWAVRQGRRGGGLRRAEGGGKV